VTLTWALYAEQVVSQHFIDYYKGDVLTDVQREVARLIEEVADELGFSIDRHLIRYDVIDNPTRAFVQVIGTWKPTDASPVELQGGPMDGTWVSVPRNKRGQPIPHIDTPPEGYTYGPAMDWEPLIDKLVVPDRYQLVGIDPRGPNWVYKQVAQGRRMPDTRSS
jgi:hypothetical protein